MEEARSNSGSLVLIIKLSRKPFKTLGKISEKSNEQILRKDGTCHVCTRKCPKRSSLSIQS